MHRRLLRVQRKGWNVKQISRLVLFAECFKNSSKFLDFQVVIRVRPPLPRELSGEVEFKNVVAVENEREQVITVSENLKAVLDDNGQLLTNPGPYATHTFVFDHVYDQNATQKAVYETTARAVVDSALQGYNATIFAYGQTGTGELLNNLVK